jgi:hypothetical protein
MMQAKQNSQIASELESKARDIAAATAVHKDQVTTAMQAARAELASKLEQV